MGHGLHNFLMKFSNTALFKWVYKHPLISVIFLIVFALIILFIFISFVMQNIIIPAIYS